MLGLRTHTIAWCTIMATLVYPLAADCPTAPAITGGTIVPQGTKKVRISWQETSGAFVAASSWDCSCCETRNSGGSASWQFSVTTPEGDVVFPAQAGGWSITASGTKSSPFCPAAGSGPPADPSPITQSRTVDVSALTQVGDREIDVLQLGCATSSSQFIGGPTCPYQGPPLPPTSSATPNYITVDVQPVPEAQSQFFFDLDPGLATLNPKAARMLTHKYRSDDSYDSPNFQVASTTPPQFKIEGAVTNPSTSAPFDIYFRLLDPKDSAAYTNRYGDAQENDNRASTNPASSPAVIMLSGGTNRTPVGGVLHTTYDPSNTRVKLLLEGTDRYAGDNYQVEASFEPTFACHAPDPNNQCATSAIITAWKRVYVERHSMFRKGAFLSRSANAGDRDIYVDSMRLFQNGQTVRVIHAPTLGVRNDRFDEEDHAIEIVPRNAATGDPAHLRIANSGTLGRKFTVDPRGADFSDAVGVVGNPNGIVTPGVNSQFFYMPDYGPPNPDPFSDRLPPVKSFYETMFVELADVTQRVQELPSISPIDRAQAHHLAIRWMENNLGGTPSGANPKPNHQHLLGGSIYTERPNDIGITANSAGWSYILIGKQEQFITAGTPPYNVVNGPKLIFETVAHELAHQWAVNQPPNAVLPGSDAGGHCNQTSWQDSKLCQMHWPYPRVPMFTIHDVELSDGLINFHYYKPRSGPTHSEYLQIRDTQEPVQ